MSYTVTPNFSGTKISAATITDIVNMPGSVALSYIHRTGSTFITNGVVPGDGAVIASSGAGNDGSYLIVSVPDEEVLIVRANLTNETGVATVQVLHAAHILTIEDEATTDFGTIFTQVAEPAYVDRIQARGGSGGTEFMIYGHSFAAIDIHATSPSQQTVFTSEREVVFCRIQGIGTWPLRTEVTNVVDVHLILGDLSNASDPRSWQNGAVWINSVFSGVSGSMGLSAYGSMIIGSTSDAMYIYDGGQVFGCIIFGNLDVAVLTQTGAGVEIQDLIQYGHSIHRPLFVVDDVARTENVLMGDIGLTSLLILGAPFIFEDLAFGDALPSPPYQAALQDVGFLDLKEDVADISTVVQAVGNATDIRKQYTYIPTVVDDEGNAVVGAHMRIEQFEDSTPAVKTPISGSPFTTDVNGQINSGDGVVMETQHYQVVVFPTVTDNRYSYLIVIEMEGFARYEEIIKPTLKTVTEVGLRRYQPALEGEEATI